MTGDHAGLVDNEDVSFAKQSLAILPPVFPGSQRSRLDARSRLEPISRDTGKRCTMYTVALPLPCITRGG